MSDEHHAHLDKLRLLSRWLHRNPKKQRIVEEEAAAVDYAIEQLEGSAQA